MYKNILYPLHTFLNKQIMAKSSLENNVLLNKLFGGEPAVQTGTDPVTPTASEKFANFAGTSDRKVMAKNLGDLGMQGAEQIYNANPDPTNPDSIKHNQGDWKIAAVQKILEKAHDKDIRDPATAMANKKYLMSGLSKEYQDALNNDTFTNLHGNFWNIISEKLIPQQWAKSDKENNLVAQK